MVVVETQLAPQFGAHFCYISACMRERNMTNTWVPGETHGTLRYNGRDATEVVAKMCISGEPVVQWSSLWGQRGNVQDEQSWRQFGNRKLRQQNRYQFQHPPAHYYNPLLYNGICFFPPYDSIRRGIRSNTNDETRPYSREEMFENDDEEDENSDDPDEHDPEEDERILVAKRGDLIIQQEWGREINQMFKSMEKGSAPAHFPVQKPFRIWHEKLVSRSNRLKARRGRAANEPPWARPVDVPVQARRGRAANEPPAAAPWARPVEVPVKARAVDAPVKARPVDALVQAPLDVPDEEIPLDVLIDTFPLEVLVDIIPLDVLVGRIPLETLATIIPMDVLVGIVARRVPAEIMPPEVPVQARHAGAPVRAPEVAVQARHAGAPVRALEVPVQAPPLLVAAEPKMLDCVICLQERSQSEGFMSKCDVGAALVCEECFFDNMAFLTVGDHAVHRLHCCKNSDDWTIQEVLEKCTKERIPAVLLYTDSLRAAEKNKLVEMLSESGEFVDDTTKSLPERVVAARRQVSDLLCDACPVCSKKHFGHDDCVSISCSHCKDKNGEVLNFCGWCRSFVGNSDEVHSHIHFCPCRLPRIPGQFTFLTPANGLSELASNIYKMRLIDKFLVRVSREVSRLVLLPPNPALHCCIVPDPCYTIHRCAIKSKSISRMSFTSTVRRPSYQTATLLLASAG